MDYILNSKEYSLSYQELRREVLDISLMTDNEFINNLPKAIHLACIVCWMKEKKASDVLSDIGIIHQLAHLLHIPDEPLVNVQKIREQFNNDLNLSE